MIRKTLNKWRTLFFAAALAFALWFMIMNFSDPMTSATIRNVPVTVRNASYLESMGFSYSISDGYDTVSVTVKGSRSAVEKLTASSVSVVADMTQIVNMDATPVMVPVTVTAPGIATEDVSAIPGNISIEIEDMVNKDFVITPSVGGTTPANGYEVGELSVSPEKLTVRGPESLVDKIDRVIARVDVSRLRKDSALTPEFSVFDRNGEALTDSQMSYLTLSVDNNDTSVSVDLYKVVTGVTVEVETTGTPVEGYQVGTITVTPAGIAVVGDDEALAELAANGNKITITPENGAVDVTDMYLDFDVNVDIRDYLPNGISLAQDSSNTVVVTVQILPFNSKSVTFESRQIEVRGLSSGMNCVFGASRIEVKVSGSDEALATATANTIRASINVGGLAPGTHTVPVDLILGEGLELAETPQVQVTLSRTETQTNNAP